MNRKGTLIALEGLDGSGKQTQSGLLKENLEKLGYKARVVSAPYYGKWHCEFVERHLAGQFGKNAKEINPYKASNFYAVDRLGGYEEDWKEDYENGVIIICDRYVGSNMLYQSSKFDKKEDKMNLIKWIGNLEYDINGLPIPDVNLMLSVKPEISEKLRKNKRNKATNGEELDIYENNLEFLIDIYNNANFVVDLLGWETIQCDNEKGMRSIEEIAKDILELVRNKIEL